MVAVVQSRRLKMRAKLIQVRVTRAITNSQLSIRRVVWQDESGTDGNEHGVHARPERVMHERVILIGF